MKKIYEINQMCYINQNNPTPSKVDFDIAVNIVPCEKNDKFENFVLGIDNIRSCCEYFGAGIINPPKKDKLFIKAIEVFTDINIDKEIEKDTGEDITEYKAVRIITDEGDIYAYVFNNHNGHYYHTIFYANDELKIDAHYEYDI